MIPAGPGPMGNGGGGGGAPGNGYPPATGPMASSGKTLKIVFYLSTDSTHIIIEKLC